MNNKIIGLIAIAFFNIGILAYTFFVEGAPGGFFIFLSLPSFVFVIGVGGGLTIMRKHTIEDKNLGKSLSSDLILAGWLGFLTGLILMFAGFSGGNIDNFAGGFAAAAITILYGYYMGAIAEAFMTK